MLDLGPCPPKEGPTTYLIRADIYSGYEFASCECSNSSKTIIDVLQNALLPGIIFHMVLFLTKESYYRWRGGTLGTQSWNPIVLPCSLHPEVSGLIEKWNVFLKTELQWQM